MFSKVKNIFVKEDLSWQNSCKEVVFEGIPLYVPEKSTALNDDTLSKIHAYWCKEGLKLCKDSLKIRASLQYLLTQPDLNELSNVKFNVDSIRYTKSNKLFDNIEISSYENHKSTTHLHIEVNSHFIRVYSNNVRVLVINPSLSRCYHFIPGAWVNDLCTVMSDIKNYISDKPQRELESVLTITDTLSPN